MTLGARSAIVLFFIILFISSTSYQHSYAQDSVRPYKLALDIFGDGVVQVYYVLKTNSEVSNVIFSIFGLTSEGLLILDENGTVLDYTLNGSMLDVDSLGASELTVEYYTQDLTTKNGNLWTLFIITQVDFNITFPVDATIIDISQIPLKIGTDNQHPVLTMPKGPVNISYIIGAIGPKSLASEAIALAEQTISGARAKGIIVTQAEAKLAEANNLFKAGNYTGAKTNAEAAVTLALSIQQKAETATSAIKDAETAISYAKTQGRTQGITEAEELLQRATEAYSKGLYSNAEDSAKQSRTKAETASTGFQIPVVALVVSFTMVAVIGIFLFIKKRRGQKVNTEKIFRMYPWLKQEHRTIILLLAEKGGAFEAEIREKLELPKSTAWRIMKKLEEEDILEIQQVRGQNYVKLRKK